MSEWYIGDDMFVKQMRLPYDGAEVAQHSHEYEHVTMLAWGIVDLWCDGKGPTRHWAPCPITIPAGTMHRFKASGGPALLFCIHNLHGLDYPEVRAENPLTR